MSQDFVFVHIQKTGGSSIRAALGLPRSPPEKHRTAAELRASMGDAEWRRRFSFAFVRNPWDRMVSWWGMMRPMIGRDRSRITGFQRYVLDTASTFEEFVLLCHDTIHDLDGQKCAHRDQTSYLVDEGGDDLVQLVGRYEIFESDFRKIAKAIEFPLGEIPRLNVSKHDHYRDYYSAETRDAVARSYARDIARFGYEF